MKIYVVMSAVVLTICSCKPRVDKTALLEDSQKSPEMVTLGGLLKGVTLPAATPGVWAFGKKPESVTKWPSPEGYEQDKYGRLTWPTNWPISPTGAMPYEKLYSHKRNLEGGEIVVGDEDYHFDCDDFALSYHRWCKYNAGKQCQSIRVDGLTLGKTSTVSLKIERKSESEFTATESVDENAPKWARDFLGVYTLPPIDVNGPDVYSSKLRFKNHIYSYAYVDGTFSGKSWQRTFPCDSETKLCSYFISYLPNRPFIEVSLVSHDKKSGHVMIAHEVEASPNLNKYCLVEYYYWPEDGGDKPLIYGCWSQSKEDQAIKIPPYVLDKIPTMFGGDSNYTVGWVSKEPNHSEVSDEFEFSKIKVGHSNVKVATLPSTNLSYKLNEPEYNRLKATSFLFSYITGLDAHSAQPLTKSEISKRYLDNPRALEIYFVLSGQFPEARKADHDPFRRNSNFSVRQFGDIKKSLLDLEKMGALSK